jgi:hypothetical protein
LKRKARTKTGANAMNAVGMPVRGYAKGGDVSFAGIAA